MGINVAHYGTVRPEAVDGIMPKPVRVERLTKLPMPKPAKDQRPFGKRNPVNAWTGRHIPLNKRKAAEAQQITLDALYDTDLDQDTTDANPRPADGDRLQYDADTEMWKAAESVPATAIDPGLDVQVIGLETEGTDRPLLDTWVAGGDLGAARWVITRVVYDHTGSKIAYAFARKETFDKYGRLYSISAETRITVDVPVSV
jgi:hypothetical protein